MTETPLKEKMKAGQMIGDEVLVTLEDNRSYRTKLWGFDEAVVMLGPDRMRSIPVTWPEILVLSR